MSHHPSVDPTWNHLWDSVGVSICEPHKHMPGGNKVHDSMFVESIQEMGTFSKTRVALTLEDLFASQTHPKGTYGYLP